MEPSLSANKMKSLSFERKHPFSLTATVTPVSLLTYSKRGVGVAPPRPLNVIFVNEWCEGGELSLAQEAIKTSRVCLPRPSPTPTLRRAGEKTSGGAATQCKKVCLIGFSLLSSSVCQCLSVCVSVCGDNRAPLVPNAHHGPVQPRPQWQVRSRAAEE